MLYTAFACRYGASTVLGGLTNMTLSNNPEVRADPGPGSPFPQFANIMAQRPRLTVTSQAIAAWLAVTGATGAAIDGTNNLASFWARLGTNGLPAAGSVHRSYTMSRGLLVPRRLNIGSRQFATLDAEAISYSSDGAAHPVAISDTAALPTPAIDNNHHTIGKVVLGTSGSTIDADCLNNITVDFGSRAESLPCGSSQYDEHIQQPGISPIVTLRGIDATIFGSAGVPPVGRALSHDATTIYLRKYALNGIGFVPDATAEHIALTVCGVAVVTEHTGSGLQRGEVTVQITTRWDGTNAPITIDTASDIP